VCGGGTGGEAGTWHTHGGSEYGLYICRMHEGYTQWIRKGRDMEAVSTRCMSCSLTGYACDATSLHDVPACLSCATPPTH
jgi:hypothetical protein